jgi:hypothetical protein
MDNKRGSLMDINDYKKIRNKMYEDFKKENPKEYAKLKEIEQKDLEKFFEDNFAKKVKVNIE